MTILTQYALSVLFFNYNLDGSLARSQRLHKLFYREREKERERERERERETYTWLSWFSAKKRNKGKHF